MCTLQDVLQLTEDGKIGVKDGACFNSQEYETPSAKELQKIQARINIPQHYNVSSSQESTFNFIRCGEGVRSEPPPIFFTWLQKHMSC